MDGQMDQDKKELMLGLYTDKLKNEPDTFLQGLLEIKPIDRCVKGTTEATKQKG